MRWTRHLPAAALAVTAALAVPGCTPGPAHSAGGRSRAAAAAPAVTDAQALQAFGSYVAASEMAARTGDAALALSDVTGVQRSQVAIAFKSARDEHLRPPYGQAAYGTPDLYLPAPAGYPRWFAAGVSRTLTTPSGQGTAGVVTSLVNPGQALMIFEQASARAPWKLASTSLFSHGVSLPPVAASHDGQATVLAMSQADGLLASPDTVGPLVAAVVDDGPSSPAARVVASGPLSTGLYQVARAGMGLKTPRGDIHQWELEGSGYAQFALRTRDGGALVFFTMYLDSTVEVPSELNQSEPVNPGPPISVPAGLKAVLPAGTTAPRVRLERQDLLTFAAIDPAASDAGGKIQVIALGDALNYASAS